jgi:hypothetical protein
MTCMSTITDAQIKICVADSRPITPHVGETVAPRGTARYHPILPQKRLGVSRASKSLI